MTTMNSQDSEPEPMDTEESNQNITDNRNNFLDNEKMERKQNRKVNKEKQRENLVTSGNLFIIAFKKLLLEKAASKEAIFHYFERFLHSMFFIGHISIPPISPNEFLPDNLIEHFKKIVPKAFNEYNTHLPYYTPYAIFLEFMTESLKPEDPDLFLTELATINESLWKVTDEEGNQPIANDFALTATVVTHCCVKDSCDAKVLKKAYGSSMSCKGKNQRKIMIAISTLHVWDKVVSYAVCCAGKGPPITFPNDVHCNAYNLKTQGGGYKKIPPCTKCNKMYIVKFSPEYQAHNKKEDWLYGNCAENESFSRLLQNDRNVRENTCIKGENGETLMNREDIENKFKEIYEDDMKKTVKSLLSSLKFKFSSGECKLFIPSKGPVTLSNIASNIAANEQLL
ncbi:uncharacterized protein ACNLHF_018856 [Anomaloglossus baeobatrachus]|uniref:uncharacterized protein LOC142309977 n=1 Tax=Anomaloglossus baeobatrachus TaxID=238106 RepID=UPI003F5048C0